AHSVIPTVGIQADDAFFNAGVAICLVPMLLADQAKHLESRSSVGKNYLADRTQIDRPSGKQHVKLKACHRRKSNIRQGVRNSTRRNSGENRGRMYTLPILVD